MTWSGFDPQLTPMKAARATAAAAAGLLACSICCCNGLLGLLQVTALSHSSIPQFQAWLHPLSPLTTHHLPSSSQNLLPLPPSLHFSPLAFSTQKRPNCPLCCLVGSKTPLWQWVAHFTWQPGSCWTTPRSALSVSQSSQCNSPQPVQGSSGPVRDLHRTALTPTRSATQTQPAKCFRHPRIRLPVCVSEFPCVTKRSASNAQTQRQTHPKQILKSNSACQVCQPCLNVLTSQQIICSPIIYTAGVHLSLEYSYDISSTLNPIIVLLKLIADSAQAEYCYTFTCASTDHFVTTW